MTIGPTPTSAAATARPPKQAVPFTARDVVRQLRWDALLRNTATTVVILLLIASMADLLNSAAMVVAIAVWMGLSMVDATVLRLVPRIGALLERDPVLAESLITDALRRRPLQPTVRLTIYHRLALLRHTQRRFAETAAICRVVLEQNARWYRRFEPSLLLMLTDASLECHDLLGAYTGLARLHVSKLGLVESLQRLALQVRYDIACGHDAQALDGVDRKIGLIELMPPPTCGALHAMLAGAAQRTGRPELADWFQRRAQLLCTPAELDTYLSSRVHVTA
ncbi:MAG: hypothetical protein K8S99_14015 [Planctomycetes bacterium]|nr:hypothetical protein [Planctomycetota bacterium]